jgi:hypothetical protein
MTNSMHIHCFDILSSKLEYACKSTLNRAIKSLKVKKRLKLYNILFYNIQLYLIKKPLVHNFKLGPAVTKLRVSARRLPVETGRYTARCPTVIDCKCCDLASYEIRDERR